MQHRDDVAKIHKNWMLRKIEIDIPNICNAEWESFLLGAEKNQTAHIARQFCDHWCGILDKKHAATRTHLGLVP
jgi:hypothetical protein